jgi:ATP-dependent helicase HrpB
MAQAPSALPIDSVLPQIGAHLASQNSAVLVAPPGAGKTTRVPLFLLEQDFCRTGKIIVLEPRRLAARAAAERMASMLGEQIGQTIGLRVRLQSKISNQTRIEIVTEGVFTRMILDDPALEGVAAVLFDEYHERSLDADLGLALALDAQSGLREDLRILVMSATLDGARVAGLLGKAPVIEGQGRAYPIETLYVGRDPLLRIEEQMVKTIMQALNAQTGSLLAFLPGQGEIIRTANLLSDKLKDPLIDVCPLYGAMDREAQDLAVSPAKTGRRKIVLATSIAETSLTIEGVRVVIDSGLARIPRYEPDLGLTRLETVRASRAAADQRRGRAGRTEPGVCYRLWEEAATGALEAFSPPEILSADLSSLVLDLAAWGLRDPYTVSWLDPPPLAALTEARLMLRQIGALDDSFTLTDQGRHIRALALPPRLARMVVEAATQGQAQLAADLAATLVERGLGGDSLDLSERVERFGRDRSKRAQDARRLAHGWAQQARRFANVSEDETASSLDSGRLIALAYPDRIAKARGKPGEFIMANGRACYVEPHDHLARQDWLAVAEISGRAASARILAAAPLTLAEIGQVQPEALLWQDDLQFDKASAALRARRLRRLGAIIIAEQNLAVPSTQAAANILANGIASLGIKRLAWTKAQKQWRDRVMFLRQAEGETWPDLSDQALALDAENWLAPFILGRSSLADIKPEDLDSAVKALLPWDLTKRLEQEAPTHYEAPTGSQIAIEYETDSGPILAIRVQELFGLSQHPTLAGGRVPLTLHLLSPAHRPIQITRDLPGFWKGSWSAVKTEMKGRYPRHVWPDDPAGALPTTRAKPRGT